MSEEPIVDVVVCVAGCAGALVAAQVIVLEKADVVGGTTACLARRRHAGHAGVTARVRRNTRT
jgi:hypothetical protein